MRFEVSMINVHGNCHEEAVIANNAKVATRSLQKFNTKSKVLEAKWFYK